MTAADAFQLVLDYMREAIRQSGLPDEFTTACDILEDIAVNEYGDD